jgi:site-specific DNA-methyltransferase (adenine-specific)
MIRQDSPGGTRRQKPVGLLRELIESSLRAGERVLDPFAGSGSTGVAAVLLGRHALLIESDRRWIDLSIRRLIAAERVAGQMDLL